MLQWPGPASSYDAAYLELALREHCHLATLDKGLITACKQAGVKVWRPAET